MRPVRSQRPQARLHLESLESREVPVFLPHPPGLLGFSSTVAAGSEEAGTVVLTVVRVLDSVGAVSVTVSVTGGTANADDFSGLPTTVTFADGDMTPKSVVITLRNDGVAEGPETIQLALTNPTGGALLAGGNATEVTVYDKASEVVTPIPSDPNPNDDVLFPGPPVPNPETPAGVLNFSSIFTGTEGGSALVTVTRTGGSAGTVSATISVTGGTASAADFTGLPLTVTFADGDSTAKTISVPLLSDTAVEGTETIQIALTGATGGAQVGTANAAEVIVLDNVSLPTEPPLPDLPPNQNLVDRMFRDLLGRSADPVGLANYANMLDRGVGADVVARGILGSVEYRTRVVSGLYLELLNRPVDPTGLADNVALLATGSVNQVKARLLGSAEYFQLNGGTNNGFLNALYQDVLRRPLDPTGRAVFTSRLQQGRSLSEVALTVLSSPEGAQKTVEALYLQYLHREADPAGLARLTSLLQTTGRPEDVLVFMLSSAEYRMRREVQILPVP